MKLNGVFIQDTFAEAWDLEVARLILTGISDDVVLDAAGQFAGAAGSSELGSRINAGIERSLSPQETPDGRPGVALSMTMPPGKRDALLAELSLRVVLATPWRPLWRFSMGWSIRYRAGPRSICMRPSQNAGAGLR